MVSVIITNYNYGIYLRKAIESVLSQTYQDFELIIADDGSTDESRQIIKEYMEKDKRIRALFLARGGGKMLHLWKGQKPQRAVL